MAKQVLIEFIKGITGEDARYGIANVEPNRALKICKIRKMRVEYFLTKIAVVLVTPKPCASCDRMDYCTQDFIEQIVQKYNDAHKDEDIYYLL